ncbi:hypothetical protein WMY93_002640 [Mugilogobius chulae]|uniref:Pentraxin family member n=1 Tax=Mugilogobius chulae TaxID=88201 RepID=A0AAW0Q5B6_9GOBI
MKLSAVLLFCAAFVGLAAGQSVRSLIFSSESTTNYVTIVPKNPLDLGAFTLCLRLATELPTEREIILFAYRTQYYDELNLWREMDGRIGMYLSGDGVFFQTPALGPTQTHLCVTWDSLSGATAVFMDGKKSLTKIYKQGHKVRSRGKIIIGQDPDEYLGGSMPSKVLWVKYRRLTCGAVCFRSVSLRTWHKGSVRIPKQMLLTGEQQI